MKIKWRTGTTRGRRSLPLPRRTYATCQLRTVPEIKHRWRSEQSNNIVPEIKHRWRSEQSNNTFPEIQHRWRSEQNKNSKAIAWLHIRLEVNRPCGVFTLPDTHSYTDKDRIGLFCYVKNNLRWTDTDTDECTDSDTDGYCIRFGAEKVEFKSFSLLLCIGITIGIMVRWHCPTPTQTPTPIKMGCMELCGGVHTAHMVRFHCPILITLSVPTSLPNWV